MRRILGFVAIGLLIGVCGGSLVLAHPASRTRMFASALTGKWTGKATLKPFVLNGAAPKGSTVKARLDVGPIVSNDVTADLTLTPATGAATTFGLSGKASDGTGLLALSTAAAVTPSLVFSGHMKGGGLKGLGILRDDNGVTEISFACNLCQRCH